MTEGGGEHVNELLNTYRNDRMVFEAGQSLGNHGMNALVVRWYSR